MTPIKTSILAGLLAFSVSSAYAAGEAASTVVKGHLKQPGYQPQAMVLLPKHAFTSQKVYHHNNNWRESVYSGAQGQIVMMTISPKTNPDNDVPNEVHDFDQMILVQSGHAKVSFRGQPEVDAPKGSWILAPAYTPHYIKNVSKRKPLKLSSIYTKWDTKQPQVAFKTKADEEAAE